MAEKKEKQQVFDDAVAFFKSVKCKPWPGDCSKESDAMLCALKMASEGLEPDEKPQQEEQPETDWKAMYLSEKERNESLSDRLMELSEKVADSLQAAQVLHGASVAESKALESQGQKKSRCERLKIAWKG